MRPIESVTGGAVVLQLTVVIVNESRRAEICQAVARGRVGITYILGDIGGRKRSCSIHCC